MSRRHAEGMLEVALTGNLASGKSTVLAVWQRAGVPVISADMIARRVVEPGSEGLEAVVSAFGSEVLSPDGSLDRARLRRVVFGDAAARERLESILHPRIAAARAAWVDARRREGATLVAAEIPLLFEAGLEKDFDVTVFVDAPEEARLARALADAARGLDEAEARRIMAAQMDPAEKRRRADRVLSNDGSREQLEARALELLAELKQVADGARAADPGGGTSGVHGAADARGARAPGSDARSLRLDLHLHTWASRDCLSDPERVLASARARGVERLAVTDHDRLGLALALAQRYPEQVIPGEEVRTAEGIDVIGLYLSEEIPKGTPARQVIERVRAQGGIVYLPHPYAAGKGGGGRLAEELTPLVDVVEVFNARLHRASLNDAADALAERHGKLKGAGSDAHTPEEVGGAYVEVSWHRNEPAALLHALAQARVHGRSASRAVHLASTWAKVRKRLPGSPGSERRAGVHEG
jgi:dephospho-CoA kinase